MGNMVSHFNWQNAKKSKKRAIKTKSVGVGFFKSQHEQREQRKRVMFSNADIRKAKEENMSDFDKSLIEVDNNED